MCCRRTECVPGDCGRMDSVILYVYASCSCPAFLYFLWLDLDLRAGISSADDVFSPSFAHMICFLVRWCMLRLKKIGVYTSLFVHILYKLVALYYLQTRCHARVLQCFFLLKPWRGVCACVIFSRLRFFLLDPCMHASCMYRRLQMQCVLYTLVILASSAWVINAIATRLVTPRPARGRSAQLHPYPVSRALSWHESRTWRHAWSAAAC
jgi:hypothetical protein